MSDDKKAPQPFNTSLFSSPGGAGSGGLSFGFDEAFSSPFSLAPALSTSTSSKQSDDGGKKTAPIGSPFSQSSLSSSSAGQSTPPNTSSPRRSASPAVPTTTTGEGISLTGLSTVSLDSPTSNAEVTSSRPTDPPETQLEPTPSVEPTRPVLNPTTYNDSDIDYRGGGRSKFGWNDPPVMSSEQTPNRPAPSRSVIAPEQVPGSDPDSYSIQPHLNTQSSLSSQLSQPAPSSVPAPNPASLGQGPPPSQSAACSNPYRIGVGIGTKKPAYGVSGIASFGSSGQPPPQPMAPPSQPLPPASVQNFAQPPLSQAPPSALYETPQPPATTSTYPLPTQVDTSVGSGWGHSLRFHWFYLRAGEKYWIPFSLTDSGRLEESLVVCGQDPAQEVLVPTDGGRYDVNLTRRLRQSVYWEEPASEVRRCSWFYKGEGDRWYLPYNERTAATLEEEYSSAFSQGQWNRRVELGGGESVIMHSQSAIVHYPSQHLGTMVPDDLSHPRAVLRGFAEVEKVTTGEQTRIDHLVFVVHGIGAHCDLNFRGLVDCVDDFREVSQLMLKTHLFSQAAPSQGDNGGRVEYLPVHWHSALHKDECGVDNRLKPLTLPSISRLRDFTNSTLTDILFFTSPVYCQTIICQVASEMNRMLEIFKARNPHFQGGVSVVGHSLGACVLFDLLDHQQGQEFKGGRSATPSAPDVSTQSLDTSISDPEGSGVKGEEPDGATPTLDEALKQLGLESLAELFKKEQVDYESLLMCTNDDLKEIGVAMGPRKKLNSYITQQAELKKHAEERREREEKERLAREKEQQRQQEAVDTTFHRATLQGVKIVRGLAGTGQPYIDYPQLSFQPRHLFAVGSPIGLFLSVRGVEELGPNFCLPTCPNLFNIFHPFDPVAYRLEPLVSDSAPAKPVLMPHHKGRKRFHLELYENIGQVSTNLKTYLVDGMRNMWQQLNEFARSHTSAGQQEQLQVTDTDAPQEELEPEPEPEVKQEAPIGRLNQGGRIDFVLQEKPIEKLNEYLFALSSHLCYWRSEDTALFILKEVYGEPNPQLIKS